MNSLVVEMARNILADEWKKLFRIGTESIHQIGIGICV